MYAVCVHARFLRSRLRVLRSSSGRPHFVNAKAFTIQARCRRLTTGDGRHPRTLLSHYKLTFSCMEREQIAASRSAGGDKFLCVRYVLANFMLRNWSTMSSVWPTINAPISTLFWSIINPNNVHYDSFYFVFDFFLCGAFTAAGYCTSRGPIKTESERALIEFRPNHVSTINCRAELSSCVASPLRRKTAIIRI